MNFRKIIFSNFACCEKCDAPAGLGGIVTGDMVAPLT